MPSTRTYADACGMSHALDLVGARWALHVVRELTLGPKRYSDLKADLAGISSNLLSDRLKELEQVGVIRHRALPRPAPAQVYELTEYGAELEPIIRQLGRWALRSPLHRPDLPLTATAFALSLRTNLDANRAGNARSTYGLVVNDIDLQLHLDHGALTVQRGTPTAPDAALEGPLDLVAELFYDGRDLKEAIDRRLVTVHGDRQALRHLLSLFSFPEKVAALAASSG